MDELDREPLQIFLGVGSSAEIQEVKIEAVEGESFLPKIESVSFECEAGPKLRKFFRETEKMFDVAHSNKICWKKYIAKDFGEWNKLTTISPEFNVNRLPKTATSIVVSPKKVFRRGFVSCFYYVAKNYLDNEWYVLAWYVVPTKQAKKLSKVLYRSHIKEKDSEKVKQKKRKKFSEFIAKFEVVFVDKDFSWIEAD